MCDFQSEQEGELRKHEEDVHGTLILKLFKTVRELLGRIDTLSDDIHWMKKESVFVNKDVYALLRDDIIKEVKNNTDTRIKEAEQKMRFPTKSDIDKEKDTASKKRAKQNNDNRKNKEESEKEVIELIVLDHSTSTRVPKEGVTIHQSYTKNCAEWLE